MSAPSGSGRRVRSGDCKKPFKWGACRARNGGDLRLAHVGPDHTTEDPPRLAPCPTPGSEPRATRGRAMNEEAAAPPRVLERRGFQSAAGFEPATTCTPACPHCESNAAGSRKLSQSGGGSGGSIFRAFATFGRLRQSSNAPAVQGGPEVAGGPLLHREGRGGAAHGVDRHRLHALRVREARLRPDFDTRHPDRRG